MQSFEVTGIRAATGRKNTKTYRAHNKMAAWAHAERDGIAPETVRPLPEPEPTERQIQYATDLGIQIPENATLAEVSDLIDNAVRNKQPADRRTQGFADRYGVDYTRYTSKPRIFERIHHALLDPSRAEELAAWFIFRVHRHLVHGSTKTEVQDADHKGIRAAAAQLADDQKFLDSIRKNYGDDTLIWFGELKNPQGDVYRGASTRTYAYNVAKNAAQRWVTGNETPALRDVPVAYPSRTKTAKPPKAKTSATATLWAIILIVIFTWILL